MLEATIFEMGEDEKPTICDSPVGAGLAFAVEGFQVVLHTPLTEVPVCWL